MAEEQDVPQDEQDLETTDAPALEEQDLAAEVAALKDQLMRAMAEAENTRRRMKKEAEDGQKYAVGQFAKEMLGIADNFQRALESTPRDSVTDPAMKNLMVGVEATERQLMAAFERFGIKKMDPMGQPFDPHFHRVMMEQEDTAKPVGTILTVLQPGYMIHDRLLREALVIVAKGGAPAHKVDKEV